MTTTTTTVMIRLNKWLVQNGFVGSRREADRYIRNGYVRIDGRPTTHEMLGYKVPASAAAPEIELAPRAVRLQRSQRTVLLHKPLGIVSCQPETPQQIPAIRLCTWENQYRTGGKPPELYERMPPSPKDDIHGKWFVAGRLDVNSTGLLVLTQSGRIASQILGNLPPDDHRRDHGEDGDRDENSATRTTRSDSGHWNKIEKEYLVRVPFPLYSENETAPAVRRHSQQRSRQQQTASIPPENEAFLDRTVRTKLERLRDGVYDDGDELFCQSVDVINPHQLRFVLADGKYHHIRRMCDAVGFGPVRALKRVRIGRIVLGDLPVGQWRFVQTPHESFV